MRLLVDSCVFIDSFDPQSPNHAGSLQLLEDLRLRGQTITMPAHGWFEVQCTVQRLMHERRFIGPQIAGRTDYPVELMHIDQEFIQKYAMADVPYIKAGDHIYLAVAKVNSWPLVTSDTKLRSVALQAGVKAFEPIELLQELKRGT
jgi:predicted nucleic acid-binding protein